RLPDREQRADRRRETVRAEDGVPVPEGEPEADQPVDERRDAEDEHVLAGDVRRVLHSRQPCLEKREACLHEHDEDGRDDDPEGVGGDQQLIVGHPRRSPVRWWTTLETGEVQQRPSPEEWPVRAASAIAAATRSASASSTTKARSA